jgi:hypothetical protein
MAKTTKAIGPAAGMVARQVGKKLNYSKITRGAITPITKSVPAVTKTVRAISKRLKYMGRTPGKTSRTGREVIQRMKDQGKIIKQDGVDKLKWVDPKTGQTHLVPLSKCDMGHHPVDAVTYWNDTGYQHGAKSPEVRQWMLDPNNYELQPSSYNRSLGALSTETYRDI